MPLDGKFEAYKGITDRPTFIISMEANDMARNIQTQTLQGQELVKANHRLDLTASELDQLYRIYKDNGSSTESLFNALAAAYYAGLAVGHRH